ncbi:hypothetical protein [Microseira sp. BLCC-F43]
MSPFSQVIPNYGYLTGHDMSDRQRQKVEGKDKLKLPFPSPFFSQW